ncbi:MAG: hypothetical protein QW751_00805 [Candidatus Aenigmatarchaeota archaeon]|nr:hypothetical protein [Candidatus Aenigmarchaeota archaeon]
MRGQVKIEFVLAVVAFAAIALIIATQINAAFTTVAESSRTDMLRARAIGLANLLTTDTTWLSTGQPNNISMANLIMINSTRDAFGQCSLLAPLRLGGYRLTIANSTHTLMRCGSDTAGAGAVSVMRVVWIEHDYGTLTVEMW